MAKVILKAKRDIEAGYHIYRQPSPAGELTTVRRKVAMPSDVEHSSSRATKRQRQTFSAASKRWAAIPSVIKAELRQKYGIVETQSPHGTSQTKVLWGAQLFTSQEIHGQKYHHQHQGLPPYVCMVLTDEHNTVLDLPGYLEYGPWLFDWTACKSYYLSAGNTLFYPIPRARHYKIGCSKTGAPTRQIFLHDRPELLELRAKTVYPHLHQWCSYAPLCYTRPPSPNWKLQAGSDTTLFWRYQVHQPTEEVAYPTTDKYYPEVAYTLMWKKLTTTEFTVTIMLGSLRRPDRLTLGNRYYQKILWTITPEGTLDPPSPIARINIPLWQILADD